MRVSQTSLIYGPLLCFEFIIMTHNCSVQMIAKFDGKKLVRATGLTAAGLVRGTLFMKKFLTKSIPNLQIKEKLIGTRIELLDSSTRFRSLSVSCRL